MPSSPTSLKINRALLWKQGWPIRTNTHKTADLKVVDLLAEQGTRLVAIDNVHVILTASGVARRDTLDAFRFLMSAGNVPLVVAGLDVAQQIFADDVELASRSIILKLPLRSEEHTSENQSLMRISYAVFCLKKKKKKHNHTHQ